MSARKAAGRRHNCRTKCLQRDSDGKGADCRLMPQELEAAGTGGSRDEG